MSTLGSAARAVNGSPPGAGWTRQFTAAEPRLSEMAELYELLCLEVVFGPATPQEGQECAACLDDAAVKTIYTRPRRNQGAGGGPRGAP